MPKLKFRMITVHKRQLIRAAAVIAIAIMVVLGTKPSIEAVFNQGMEQNEVVVAHTGI